MNDVLATPGDAFEVKGPQAPKGFARQPSVASALKSAMSQPQPPKELPSSRPPNLSPGDVVNVLRKGEIVAASAVLQTKDPATDLWTLTLVDGAVLQEVPATALRLATTGPPTLSEPQASGDVSGSSGGPTSSEMGSKSRRPSKWNKVSTSLKQGQATHLFPLVPENVEPTLISPSASAEPPREQSAGPAPTVIGPQGVPGSLRQQKLASGSDIDATDIPRPFTDNGNSSISSNLIKQRFIEGGGEMFTFREHVQMRSFRPCRGPAAGSQSGE